MVWETHKVCQNSKSMATSWPQHQYLENNGILTPAPTFQNQRRHIEPTSQISQPRVCDDSATSWIQRLNPNQLLSSSQIWGWRRELNTYTVHLEHDLNTYSLETCLRKAVTTVSRFVYILYPPIQQWPTRQPLYPRNPTKPIPIPPKYPDPHQG